jgi:hypothetical protein
MAARGKRNLYLYLAIVCFIGIIAIFVIDGYLGIYDTIYITIGEQEMTVEPAYWLMQYSGAPEVYYYIGAGWGEKVFFRYELDNRRFSSYSTSIQASLWRENEKILDLFSQDKLIKPFDKAMVEWTLDSERLQSQGFDVGEYTLKIGYNGVERRIIVNYYSMSSQQLSPVYPLPAES